MIAYALFQDWGNDPLAYDSGPKAELLEPRRATCSRRALQTGPRPAPYAEIEKLLAHDVRELTQTPDGRFGETNPPLKWHFTVDGPKHRVIAFDNRTRRSYAEPERSARQRLDGRRWSTRSRCRRCRPAVRCSW